MSRYVNLVTSERYMTEQNALRHYLSKAKKARKRNNYSEMWKIYSDATVRILITDKMVCKITDNSQVDENTVFEN